MRHVLLAAVLALAGAPSASADVTLTLTMAGEGMGVATTTPGTIYIKGLKMRSDLRVGTTIRSTIFDLEAGTMYVFDSAKTDVGVWDMRALAADLAMRVSAADVKTRVTPNDRTKSFETHVARGYDVAVAASMPLGGNDPTSVTATLMGNAWIVPAAPGAADYSRFYRGAAERGWILSDPHAASSQPGAAMAIAEMYSRIAEIGGIPYATDIQIAFSATGDKAAFLSQIGALTTRTTVEGIDTASLDDELFVPPTGYTRHLR